MNQQAPPENSRRRRPSLILPSKITPEDVVSKDTAGSLNSTAEITNAKQVDEGLPPLVTIRNSTGERTSGSLTSTTESPMSAPFSPSGGLFSPNPALGTPAGANRFDFGIEGPLADFKESERFGSDVGEMRRPLSKTLRDAITDIDPDGSLRRKTMRGKTLLPGGFDSTFGEGVETDARVEELKQSQLPGFKILTQQEIKQEHDSRSSKEKEFNISDSTIAKLQNIAQSNEIVIITRPVNSTALTLMKQDAVGKNMFVHGKSAAEDSLAEGLITVNAGSSKAGKSDDIDKIKAYNAENRESLDRSGELFELVQAKLREVAPLRRSRLQRELEALNKKSELTEKEAKNKAEIEKELKDGPTPDKLLQEAKIPAEYFDQMVFAAPVLDKKGHQIYVFQDDFGRVKKEDKQQVHGIEEGGKLYFIDKNHEHNSISQEVPVGYNKVPLQVIGKPEITIGKDGSLNIGKVRPITADIDVLAYGAKVNLQEFDKMPSYHEVVIAEKEQLLKSSTFQLTQEAKHALVNDKVDDVLRASVIPDSLKQDKEFIKLAGSFKNIEVQRENLKGMGNAPDVVMAITGAMRAEFKDSVEISHSAEQFNIGFTQALDDKWVLIDKEGKVSTISGEKELLETFSRFKAEGLSMPPNPNWGWELKEGKYEKNKDLVEISASCQQLCLKMYTLKEEHAKATGTEKEKIDGDIKSVSDILKLQTETGLMAITETRDNEKFAEHIKNLRKQIRACKRAGILTEEDIGQIEKHKESRSKIYELQEIVGLEVERRPLDIPMISTPSQINKPLESTPAQSIEEGRGSPRKIAWVDSAVSTPPATTQTVDPSEHTPVQSFNSPPLPEGERVKTRPQPPVRVNAQKLYPSPESSAERAIQFLQGQHNSSLSSHGTQITEIERNDPGPASTMRSSTTRAWEDRDDLSDSIKRALQNPDIARQVQDAGAGLRVNSTQRSTDLSRSSQTSLQRQQKRGKSDNIGRF